MPAEALSPQDATLWSVQTPEAPLQIGALIIFEGRPLRDASGRLRLADLRGHVEAGLARAPRFRQRLVALPLDQGLAWVDDDHFDIAHHLQRDVLRRPVTDRRLRNHIGKLLATRLDPARPLWEMRLIDGLEGDRVAVVLKVSHVVVDGMGLLGFAASLLDPGPTSRVEGDVPAWEPAPSPGLLSLWSSTAIQRARQQAGSLWTLARGLVDPGLLTRSASALVRVGTGRAKATPPLPITAPVGGRRDFAWVRLALDALLRVKRSEGVTLNDVVLAVVGGGLAHYLERAGGATDRLPKVLVPVSTHSDDAGSEIENRFSVMLASVPLDAASPLDRLRAVHAEMERHKQASQADVGPLFFAVGDLVPNWMLRLTGPAVLRHQPFANFTVTNLPGWRDPLFLLGARMLELYPFITVTGNLALIVGVISYEDGLGVSITVDADVIGDVDGRQVLCRARLSSGRS
jgi:WS/DGAT/MGAT family acyltransferase